MRCLIRGAHNNYVKSLKIMWVLSINVGSFFFKFSFSKLARVYDNLICKIVGAFEVAHVNGGEMLRVSLLK